MKDKFQGVQPGTLVCRSPHWYREHPTWPRGQLGIVLDRNVYEENGAFITYPVIHWEGEVSSSGTHPMNAEVVTSEYRKELARRRAR